MCACACSLLDWMPYDSTHTPSQMALGDALVTAQAQLVELDLSDNAFGPAGVEAISPLLTSPVCFSLRTLKLNNTGMGITGGKVSQGSQWQGGW